MLLKFLLGVIFLGPVGVGAAGPTVGGQKLGLPTVEIELESGWYWVSSISPELTGTIKRSVTFTPVSDVQHSPVFFGIHERIEFKRDAVERLKSSAQKRKQQIQVLAVDGETMALRESVDKKMPSGKLALWFGVVNHAGVSYWVTAGAPVKKRDEYFQKFIKFLETWKWKKAN